MKRLRFIVAAGLLVSPLSAVLAIQKAVVVVPVVDLRSDQSLPTPGVSDDKQQTQLLFGETVEVVASSGDWVQVNAIEQPEFTTHQRWEGYPGWVLKSALGQGEGKTHTFMPKQRVTAPWLQVNTTDKGLITLPLGALVISPPEARAGIDPVQSITARTPEKKRVQILKTAALLLGDPYIWGGLSPHDPTGQTRLSGVDCSGLTHLSYRVNGFTIPRDSMEQYMKAEKIKRSELKPADLVFSAKADKPEKVTHVALYAGDGQLLEAPQTGMVVRRISFKDKFGNDFSTVNSGDKVGDRVIYFGRLLKD